MEKKEGLVKGNRKALERRGLVIFALLLIVAGSGIFVYRYFSSPTEKGFGLKEKDNKIIVHGLEREEVEKIK